MCAKLLEVCLTPAGSYLRTIAPLGSSVHVGISPHTGGSLCPSQGLLTPGFELWTTAFSAIGWWFFTTICPLGEALDFRLLIIQSHNYLHTDIHVSAHNSVGSFHCQDD